MNKRQGLENIIENWFSEKERAYWNCDIRNEFRKVVDDILALFNEPDESLASLFDKIQSQESQITQLKSQLKEIAAVIASVQRRSDE